MCSIVSVAARLDNIIVISILTHCDRYDRSIFYKDIRSLGLLDLYDLVD